MGNRKKEILSKMKIVYMGEGLNTIDDLPKSKRKKLYSESSSVSSMPSQASNSSKSSEQKKIMEPTSKPKKKKGKMEKPEVKPKFETLLKNLPLTERRLLRARNGIPFKLTEDCGELPVDYSSTVEYCAKQLSQFTDVNEGEQKIMNMWNLHIISHMGRGFTHLPRLLEAFIKDKGQEIVEGRLFRNAMLMISSFQHSGVLDAVDCLTAKSQLQIYVAEYVKEKGPTSTMSSSQQQSSQGVGTSTFYGSSKQTSPNFRRSLDDHLPCRRNLSPDLASRTLSLDTRMDEDRPRISRKGRSRLNSKGGAGTAGGSPGRGSPVRGNNLACGAHGHESNQSQEESQISINELGGSGGSIGTYRRSVIVGKRGSAIRNGLWQGGNSERLPPESTEESGVDTRKNRLSSRLHNSSSIQPMTGSTTTSHKIKPLLKSPSSSTTSSKAYCSHFNEDKNQESDVFDHSTKRKQDSPTDIENFLKAFDHKIENGSTGIEDIEAELPVFVVVPKSKKRREAEKESDSPVNKNSDQGGKLSHPNGHDVETNSDDCQVVEQVYTSQRRASRSKTS